MIKYTKASSNPDYDAEIRALAPNVTNLRIERNSDGSIKSVEFDEKSVSTEEQQSIDGYLSGKGLSTTPQ